MKFLLPVFVLLFAACGYSSNPVEPLPLEETFDPTGTYDGLFSTTDESVESPGLLLRDDAGRLAFQRDNSLCAISFDLVEASEEMMVYEPISQLCFLVVDHPTDPEIHVIDVLEGYVMVTATSVDVYLVITWNDGDPIEISFTGTRQ